MTEKYLHIVSFNIPYPANYGGVIDVFYRIKALSENNIKIILHAFEYGREQMKELNSYCEKVHYYKRKTGFCSQLSTLPYIVYSRKNNELLQNLLQDNYPILFEGLHCCYYLSHSALKDRLKFVRMHNIEHKYYKGLLKNTRSFKKKIFFAIESRRLKQFEHNLQNANYILALSTTENAYFEETYGKEKTRFVPLFAPAQITGLPQNNTKPYVLFHGDLSTPENINGASFLIKNVAPLDNEIQWIFAGLNPDKSLLKSAYKQSNVSIRANLSDNELAQLINEAAVNILYTNQVSGVKLKLLNALYNGQHCLANRAMVTGSNLESLCHIISDKPEEIISTIKVCMEKQFDENERANRLIILKKWYGNNVNAQKIIELL